MVLPFSAARPLKSQRRLHAWLGLSVAALVGAGLFALLVALSRTPGIQEIFPGGDYLRKALVGHVILAVVVWFLAFQGGLWTLASDAVGTGLKPAPTGWIGFWIATVGTSAMTVSAVLGRGDPVLANYIPVLTDPLFLAGLVLFGVGMGLAAVHALRTIFQNARPVPLIAYGAGISAALVLWSLLCFVLAAVRLLISTHALPAGRQASSLTPHAFEALVWGGGHVLQFANSAAMVLSWLLLVPLTLNAPAMEERWAKRLLMLYAIAALPAPFLYLGDASRGGLALLMAFGLGPAAAISLLAILRAVWFQRRRRPWGDPRFSGLILSTAVFGLGGLLSMGIRGSNVVIPAHYHGMIGGVTLAFMGLSYHLLTLIGRTVWSVRLARYQPYLYGVGQVLFVLGLFWAGVHGVPRKTFGAAQVLQDGSQWIGMTLMGLGGLVAIAGGVAFVLNLVPSLLEVKRRELIIGDEEWEVMRRKA